MHRETPRQRVVVIGGGLTGLTVCYRLSQVARERRLPLDITLLEASERLGGVIATSQQQGLLLEQGPDCFLTTKPWGVRLCEELGLHEQFINTTTQQRRSFIVRHGRLRPVPRGLYLMIPGSLWPFATSSILSWRGKARMALDLCLPRRTSTADESLAHFVTRRLGREALERRAQPMVGGIYSADPNKDSKAIRYAKLSYMDALKNRLEVMDSTAFSLCMDNHIPIIVFNLFKAGNIKRVIMGGRIGSIVCE